MSTYRAGVKPYVLAAVLCLPACVSADPLTEMSPDITVAELEAQVTWFADEERLGRGLSDPEGLEASADFIAERFADLGLEPWPGLTDYSQIFELPMSLGYDFAHLSVDGEAAEYVPLSFSKPGSFSGRLAFVGYGVSTNGYDDFADVDVEGKVVLMLRYEPFDGDGKSRLNNGEDGFSSNASLTTKVEAAEKAGAIAVLLVNPPMHSDETDLRSFGMGRTSGTLPALHINAAAADELLADAKLPTLAYLQGQIDANGTPNSIESDSLVSGGWRGNGGTMIVRNVVGVLPGTNADEYVVVGAHYDHLGDGSYGSGSPGDIHNGADDNASGTSAVLEVAEALAMADEKPERSVAFILFTAEEIGLVGSREFVRQLDDGPVSSDAIVAMLNLDMVGRVREDKLFVGGGETSPKLPDLAEQAINDVGLTVETMRAGGRSDHAPFIAADIPALFLFSGLHDVYHTPDDDVETINFEGIRQVSEAATAIVTELAAMPRDELAFERQTRGVRLGVQLAGESLKIGGVAPNSPAATAGLLAGDQITAINGRDTATLASLRSALFQLKPGDDATVTVERDGEEVELDVSFPAPTTRPG